MIYKESQEITNEKLITNLATVKENSQTNQVKWLTRWTLSSLLLLHEYGKGQH